MNISFHELSIYEIEQFQKDILQELQSTTQLFTLDFENVEKIDLSSIQLLLSVKKYCDEKNIKFDIVNLHSKHIKQTFNIFNLNSNLGVSL